MNDTHQRILRLVYSSLFLGVAYLLPFLTGQIPRIGMMLCPMHIPVLLCGFLCGWPWGLAVGLIAPLLRSLTLGLPMLFPQAFCMSLELAAYGFVSGLAYRLLPRKRICLYGSLALAMIVGRLVWGAAMFLCMGLAGGHFGMMAFLSGAFAKAIPGIVLQIVLIPPIVEQIMRARERRKTE